MSSHHVVRDEQEPAVLIIDAHFSHEIAGQLLEWSPVVGVWHSCLDAVLAYGCKIDAVFCEAGQEGGLAQLLEYQWPVAVVPIGQTLEGALQWFIEKGHKAINICGPFDNGEGLPAPIAGLDMLLLGQRHRLHWAKQGIWEKWLPKNAEIKLPAHIFAEPLQGLQPAGNGHWRASAQGMAAMRLHAPCWVLESLFSTQS